MMRELAEAILQKDAPVVVGLDPQLKMLPEAMLPANREESSDPLQGAADALYAFNQEIIDWVYDLIPAVKPQIAMYERFGAAGVKAYADTVHYAKQKGLIVIGDTKRGDIGSTAEAYADGHIGHVTLDGKTVTPFAEDFTTVNPYLGSDGVKPFIDICNNDNKGIFVLVKTSNPGSGELQDLTVQTDKGSCLVYEHMADLVSGWGTISMDGPYSNVGAVVGATYPEVGKVLRKRMPHTFFLVPGYGAQGATAKDLVPFFHEDFTGAVINSSRGIIAAWQGEACRRFQSSAHPVGEAARQAVVDMLQEIREAFAAAGRKG